VYNPGILRVKGRYTDLSAVIKNAPAKVAQIEDCYNDSHHLEIVLSFIVDKYPIHDKFVMYLDLNET
jgi:hypothetical protein